MAAASSIAEDFDEEFLTCPVCKGLYEDPKLLPCFHTFCRKCVEAVANNSGGTKFKCPVCRSDVVLPCPAFSGGVDKLKSNFYINKLLDIRKLRQSKTSQVLCQMCESHTQAAAVCGDCIKMLCNNCVTAHRNTKELQNHSIITLYDLENPTARSRYARQIHCPKHKDQRMTFYCEPCESLVCIYCTVDDHRAGTNHDPKELEKVAPKYRDSIRSQMKKTEAVMSQMKQKAETLDRELTATAENCDQVEREVHRHYADLISKLQQEKQDMITKIHKTKKDRKDELIQKKNDMESSLSELVHFSIDVQEPAVESLPCSVTVTPDTVGLTGGDVAPQIEVTSPQGKTTLIQTTAHTSPPLAAGKGQTSRVRRVWGAEWRPQESGKHSLGVCMGGKKDLGSLTVDVGSNNPVLRFGQKGSQQGQFDRPVDVAVRGDRLNCTHPYGLAVQRDGRVVVADVGKHSIFLFEADGTLVKQVGGQGQGEGQFDMPCFVCVDKEDNIIVADKNNHRVQVFDKNLKFKHKFGQKGRQPQDMFGPNGVSADSRGNIVLSNIGGRTDSIKHGEKLQVFRADGTWVSTISSDGDKLNLPHGVAVTEDGHVFVADAGDHCIRKYRYM
ncbi:TRIM2 [Branchiostoma lanceolatum]|uniref:RING-type E3 ubiquitin transferase n=1 Tax=Branchiostoma lanceolatum TaxID=7740 RepID=A0A8K0E8S3_BRALA|nr:TRIM2 [Branchiostoma lanceolatum]